MNTVTSRKIPPAATLSLLALPSSLIVHTCRFLDIPEVLLRLIPCNRLFGDILTPHCFQGSKLTLQSASLLALSKNINGIPFLLSRIISAAQVRIDFQRFATRSVNECEFDEVCRLACDLLRR